MPIRNLHFCEECDVLFSLVRFHLQHLWLCPLLTYTCVCVCLTDICLLMVDVLCTVSSCLGKMWASLDSCPAGGLSYFLKSSCTCVCHYSQMSHSHRCRLFSLLEVSEMLKLQKSDDLQSTGACVCVCVSPKTITHTSARVTSHACVCMHFNKCFKCCITNCLTFVVND